MEVDGACWRFTEEMGVPVWKIHKLSRPTPCDEGGADVAVAAAIKAEDVKWKREEEENGGEGEEDKAKWKLKVHFVDDDRLRYGCDLSHMSVFVYL